MGRIQTGGVNAPPPPYSLVDLHTVGAPSAELIFAFAWMSHRAHFGDSGWGVVLKTGVL